jgi:hypothetical protein
MQLQRIRGELILAPVKTHAGKRDLPMLDVVRQALDDQAERQAAYRIEMGRAWPAEAFARWDPEPMPLS